MLLVQLCKSVLGGDVFAAAARQDCSVSSTEEHVVDATFMFDFPASPVITCDMFGNPMTIVVEPINISEAEVHAKRLTLSY